MTSRGIRRPDVVYPSPLTCDRLGRIGDVLENDDAMTEHSRWAAAAVTHVRDLSRGDALDGSLRVTLSFHPDRGSAGSTVLEHLVQDGVYRSQFETGTSNGGLTAHPGGDRWQWEQRIFGGAYHDAPARERPKYGALNHRQRRIGGALRFGSSHLRLADQVRDRTTFCFPDSALGPTDFGTAERFCLTDLADAFDILAVTDWSEADTGGVLDDYIEAHVHGVINLSTDVEAIVLDPCYRATPVEAQAHLLPVPVEWHEGRRLSVDELSRHPSFRGPRIVEVGIEIAEQGWLDARIVGSAVAAGGHDPQDVKKVWHHVARFGQPEARSSP